MPIHTVSLSEGGFEKVFQGTCTLFIFEKALAADEEYEINFQLYAGPVDRAQSSANPNRIAANRFVKSHQDLPDSEEPSRGSSDFMIYPHTFTPAACLMEVLTSRRVIKTIAFRYGRRYLMRIVFLNKNKESTACKISRFICRPKSFSGRAR